MKLGIEKIVGKISEGDEYGIYRRTEEGYEYLMFSTSTYREAILYGSKIAKLLGVPFMDFLPVPEHPEAEEGEGITTDGNKTKAVEGLDQTAGYFNIIHPSDNYDPSNKQSMRPKPKRVSGVAKKVEPMIEAGKTDHEIFQIMLPEYLAANRTEKEARELLLPYLKDIRAGKY